MIDTTLLLRKLIGIPRQSKNEQAAADMLTAFVEAEGFEPKRKGNNLWIEDTHREENRPTLLLNAHIDTVQPTEGWTTDPYTPREVDGKLYGIGSNDCGGGLVALLATFIEIMRTPDFKRNYNLVYAASAEEEISGHGGFEALLPCLPKVDAAIVGEPTGLQPAIAERGLMVIDCVTEGQSGHAARSEGINALYLAIDDLEWVRNYSFERVSPLLGKVKMTATIIKAGTQHNVVPDRCYFTLDVRINELYTNEEILSIIRNHVKAKVTPRSTRLHSSRMAETHPLVIRLKELGLCPFGSATLSDQALMPFPSVKIGPGDSARSHTADEYIYLREISSAVELYMKLLDGLRL